MNSKKTNARRRAALMGFSALATTAMATEAFAQADRTSAQVANLQEIIVTAQKREQSLQAVPVAVTAVTEQALVANRITGLADLTALTPGLTVTDTSGGARLSTVTLRGVLNSGGQAGTDKSVALYIDGVYLGGASYGTIFNMAGIGRIEVLRGPQGTLFGRNANGGAINFITPEPTGEFGVKQTFTVGNYDHYQSVTRVSSPQWGAFSAMGVYMHSERRGDIRNLGAGTRWNLTPAYGGKPKFVTSPKYMGDNNTDAGFFAAKADFDPLSLVYKFDYADEWSSMRGNGSPYVAPSLRPVLAAQPNPSLLTPITANRPKAVNNNGIVPTHSRQYGHSLTATYRVSDAVSLKNLLAYRVNRVNTFISDVGALGGLVNTGGPFLSALISPAAARTAIGAPLLVNPSMVSLDLEQWSNELQLNVDTKPVTFTAGALYYRERNVTGFTGADGFQAKNGFMQVLPGFVAPSTVQPNFGGGRSTHILVKSYAVYGQAELHVRDNVDLIAGMRHTWDSKTGADRTLYNFTRPNGPDVPIDYYNGRPTYTVGVNYKPAADVLLYGKYATGFISGGTVSSINFGPETARSWEAGLKADWLDRTLRTNVAVYSAKYDGIQLNTLISNVPAYAFLIPLGLTSFRLNAGSAKAEGVELETTYVPVRAITLTANAPYTDFQYTKLNPVLGGLMPTARSKWTAALAAQYTSPDIVDEAHVTARIDAAWRSKYLNTGLFPTPGAFVSGGAAFTPQEANAMFQSLIVDPYWLVNARVALENLQVGPTKATIALWGRNVFNTRSPTFGFTLGTHAVEIYETARTFGLDVTFEY